MDAVAEYFIDEVETLKGFDLPEEERDAVKSRFYRMYETRDLYVLYNRFLRQEDFRRFHRYSTKKESFVMRMCIRFCI